MLIFFNKKKPRKLGNLVGTDDPTLASRKKQKPPNANGT